MKRHVFGSGPCCTKCGCNKASIEAGMPCLPCPWVSAPRPRPTVLTMGPETETGGLGCGPGFEGHAFGDESPSTWPIRNFGHCPAPTPRAP
jgi:hypothetical protein